MVARGEIPLPECANHAGGNPDGLEERREHTGEAGQVAEQAGDPGDGGTNGKGAEDGEVLGMLSSDTKRPERCL